MVNRVLDSDSESESEGPSFTPGARPAPAADQPRSIIRARNRNSRDTTRSRGFCFTHYPPAEGSMDDFLEQLFVSARATYICAGDEICPNTRRRHYQGYIYFRNARAFTAVRRLLPGCHIGAQRGTVDEAVDYCKKDGLYYEIGSPPINQAAKGESSHTKWTRVVALAEAGDFDELKIQEPYLYITMYAKLFQCYQRALPVPKDLSGKLHDHHVWIWGPPGTGKSRYARDTWTTAFSKPLNKWWDGYRGEETVLLDDVELDSIGMKHHIKIWSDRYPFIAQVKFGHISIRPDRLIVTSNYSPAEVFDASTVLFEAVARRFDVIHMTDPFNVLN